MVTRANCVRATAITAFHRGIPETRRPVSLFYRDGGGVRRPLALATTVTAAASEHPGHDVACAVHRIWHDSDRAAYAPVPRPFNALGRVLSHAVRFGDLAAGNRRNDVCVSECCYRYDMLVNGTGEDSSYDRVREIWEVGGRGAH